MSEEELKELDQLAQQLMGKGWESLTPDEKQALYTDYAGRRATLANQRADAQDMINTPTPQGIKAGNVYVASNPLAHLGKAIRGYRGAKARNKVDEQEGALSEQYSVGSAAAGRLADEQQKGMMRVAAMMMRDQQKKAAQGGSSAAGQAQPQQPAPVTQPQPQRPPMQAAANPPQPPPMLRRPEPAKLPGGGTVPGNPQEWQAYMMRQAGKPIPPGPGSDTSPEEMQRRRWEEMVRRNPWGGGF